jgi:hypothetical protein
VATGVYCITNLANGKRYIGSASKSLTKRLWTHRFLLRQGRHWNKHLQAAWDLYGRVLSEEARQQIAEKARLRWARWREEGKIKEIGDKIKEGQRRSNGQS